MPYTTLSSGLTIKVPTRGTVNWAATLLAENFQKISEHDHTGSGKGIKIAQSALNLAAGSTRAMVPLISQIQDGSVLYGGTSGGTANAQTITLAPAITALVAGMMICFKAGATSTSAATMNVNGIGAAPLKILVGAALYPLPQGAIVANGYYQLLSDGTNLILLNPASGHTLFRGTTNVVINTTSAETDLFSLTMLANTLGAYGRIHAHAYMRLVNTSGSACTFTVRAYYGSAVVSFAVVTQTGVDDNIRVEFNICGDNGTSTNDINLSFLGLDPALVSVSTGHAVTINASANITSTSDQALKMTVQPSVSNVNNSVVMYNYFIEAK